MNKNKLVGITVGGIVFAGVICFMYACVSAMTPSSVTEAGRTMTNNSHVMPDGSVMANHSGMSMNSMMEGMMQNLRGKSGPDFDRAFVSEMIPHHEGAVLMAKAALKASSRPEIIEMANAIIKTQTEEIAMMQKWQNTWAR